LRDNQFRAENLRFTTSAEAEAGYGGTAAAERGTATSRARADAPEQDEQARAAGSNPGEVLSWEAARLYLRQPLKESLPLL